MSPSPVPTTDELLLDRALAARWSGGTAVLQAAQHWLWFREEAKSAILAVAPRLDCALAVELQALAACFYQWTGALDELPAEYHDLDPADHARHVAGTLLRCLLARPPVEPVCAAPRTVAGPADALQAWCARPVQLALTRLCLTLLDAMLRQSGKPPLVLHRSVRELPTVLSFLENSGEGLDVMSFFDAFTGAEPVWTPYWTIADRPAMQRARQARDTAG